MKIMGGKYPNHILYAEMLVLKLALRSITDTTKEFPEITDVKINTSSTILLAVFV